jgi:hypothetical protein
MKRIVKGTIIGVAGALFLGTSLALSSATVILGASRAHGVDGLPLKSSIRCDKSKSCFAAQNSGSGNALDGQAGSGIGLHGQSSSGAGVYGISDSGAGVIGFTGSGIGGYFQNSGDSIPTLQAVSYAYYPEELQVSAYYGSQFRGSFTVCCGGSGDFTGDVYAAGYYTGIRTRGGDGSIGAYSSESTRASIEDVGTARLTGGEGAVRFDSRFASTIDTRRGYQVFLTPDGDTRGLYIAAKYEGGFLVREVEHGRSSLDFDYRIVAHPYGASDARLPRLNRPQPPLQPPPAIHPR